VKKEPLTELIASLRRHVGHQLRCARETSGNIGGYVVETVALRCDDCGEVVIEATQQLLKRSRRRA
jgi:hypothetical protein